MKLFDLPARVFLRDRFILTAIVLAGGLNLSGWLMLAWKIPRAVESVVLHYNIYFSIDLIGPWYRAFLAPLLGLLIGLANFFLAYWLYPAKTGHPSLAEHQGAPQKQSRLLAYFLAGTAVAVNFFLFLSALTIIFINL